MLPSNFFKNNEKKIIELYDNLTLEIIQDIADRIASYDYAKSTVLHNIHLAQEMGVIFDDVVSIVAKYNGMSRKEITRIFKEAGVKTLTFDDRVYKEAELTPIPIQQSPSMLNILKGAILNTNGELENLTSTLANNMQTVFYNVVNNAYLEISTGYKSHSQAIIGAIGKISRESAFVTYPSGHKDKVEVAVRRSLITSVNQTCGKLQLERAKEMGWDLMIISAHYNARPSHAEWQGKVVSLSGQKGYLTLEDIGYGQPDGFLGINCRHSWYPYFKGGKLLYTKEELDKYKNNTVTYNDKEINGYEATQIQRKMERTIRADKRDLISIKSALNNNNLSEKEIVDLKTDYAKKSLIYNTHQTELDNFIKETDFTKDYSRLNIGKMERSIMSEKSKVITIANKYNNNINGIVVNNVEVKQVSEHIISRTYARDLEFKDVENTLKNPIDFGTIKIDKQGRKSFNIYGNKVVISLNPDNGRITTARAINKRERKRYGIEE